MARKFTIEERSDVPVLSQILGFGPMLPFVLGAVASWLTHGQIHDAVIMAMTIWAGSILAFLAGVRRGLSFRTEGGPNLVQISTMFGLFVIALLSLFLVPAHAFGWALGLLLLGFGLVFFLDPIAAKAGDAPLFFAKLRPIQVPIAIISLAATLASLLV